MEIPLFIIMVASGQLLFKAASIYLRPTDSLMSGALEAISEWKFLLALVLYAPATFLWIKMLNQMPVSTVHLVATGSTIIISCIAGIVTYREPCSASKPTGSSITMP
jgi:multidrug transporter EmrE-like cation transporter